jgi:hypothetical protein
MSIARRGVVVRVAVACLLSAGCLQSLVPAHATDAPEQIHSPILPGDIFETLKAPADAHDELCTADDMHPNFPDDADLLTRTFCQDKKPGGKMPKPSSLAELLVQLGIDFKDPNGENGAGGNPGFALLSHSTALTARKVTTLTPTAFVFTPPPADGSKPSGYVFLAFDPGEQFVEVASHDPTADAVNLYLVLFDQACSGTSSCTPTDLLTQRLVTGWSNVRAYESSTFLNNTLADCRQCHAPDDSQPLMLRMQEIEAPFTHWLSQDTDGGRALYADFRRAHFEDEDYGPIPAALVGKSDPAKMAQAVQAAGFGVQPNAFASAEIEAEVRARQVMQPALNAPGGWSATWQALYDRAAAGQFIATPYHDVKVTDPTKLEQMVAAWQKGRAGFAIPDIRDIFFDDGLRDMGFAPRRGLDGRALLTQMCQQCHNAQLDPTITREKFLVDQLDQMSRDEKDLAIQRLQLPDDTRKAMPPVLFRTISDDERQSMIVELQK